jgi:hypothetical protein
MPRGAILGEVSLILPKFNIDPADGSVVAVIVGAFLATISGFVATQIETYNRRRDKERSAALLFGEILVGVKLTINLADRTRGRGDPYGPVTMRMVRAAQREAQTYERNRESLFDLRHPALRAQIHMLFARMIIALDGAIDASREVAATQTTMRMLPASDPSQEEFAKIRDFYAQDRAQSFDFAVELTDEIPALLEKLRHVAKYSFEAHEAIVRETVAPQVTGNPAAE